MREKRTAARPIAIASSSAQSPIRDSDDEESEHSSTTPAVGFMNTYGDLNSGMGGLTVGSLPSVRRVRRSVVSSGGNEVLLSTSHRGGGHFGGQRGMHSQQQRHGGGQHDDIAARSVPVPSAPFLSSRRPHRSATNLQSIPPLNLTDSVTESDAAASIPFGSLRESSLHRRPTLSSSQPALPLQVNRHRNANENRNISSSGGGLASLFNEERKPPPPPTTNQGEIGSASAGGGIGSAFETSSSHQIDDIGIGIGDGVTDQNRHDGSINDDNVLKSTSDETANEGQLGTSLTGLDILRSSPKTGLKFSLTPEQRGVLLQRVARTGSNGDLIENTNKRQQKVENVSKNSSHSMLLAPQSDWQEPIYDSNSLSSPSGLIPPRNSIDRSNQRQNYDDYDDNSGSEDEIFDMDE